MHDDSKDSPAPQSQPPEDLTGLHLGKPKKKAAGLPAVTSSLKHLYGLAGVVKGTKAMLKLNQFKGFDCPSCAWPDPDDHRASTEFCENGAKALASETTQHRITANFFAKHSVEEISRESDYWMEQQGRLVEPMVLREGATHYEPISWDAAFDLVARELNALPSPDEAIFYTSGRTVNEAAFLYQLFVRMYGTNNLPDCSNMCHESSGAALNSSVGVGKGTVHLSDFDAADTILIVGQNPGTNHPRMLSALQSAVREGAQIISVNPMKEAGLIGFAHPQEIRGMLGVTTPLSSRHLPVKINGDQALFMGLSKALLEAEAQAPGTILDQTFLDQFTHGFADFRTNIEGLDWADIEGRSGISQADIRETAQAILKGERKLITCWAMGLTQHRNAVATIQEVVHLHLLLGALGRVGAGLCPVRGHSNVQGDRTMGIFEKMPAAFHDAIDREFGFQSPREIGFDTVHSIKAMHEGRAHVFFAMGGNFLQATPDTEFTAEALRNCRLTAQVSTKLNRSHVVTGKTALILPCLGRSEVDRGANGKVQFCTVENSMSVVHQSRGTFAPASKHLLSETMIAARLAHATLADRHGLDFIELAGDLDKLRDRIARTVPGFEDFNKRVRQKGGFYLPNAARNREFETDTGKAQFTVHPLTSAEVTGDEFLLMTIRSHDQFNTTVYGLNDRYRGISNERRILFMNAQDMKARGIKPLSKVDIRNTSDGVNREVQHFLAIPYEIPTRTVAGYFPELNPLVPVDMTAEISNTPCSKSVPVLVEPSTPQERT